jgi:secreted trypsin-like serine protease
MFKASLLLILSLISISAYAEIEDSMQTCGFPSSVAPFHQLYHDKENISQYGEFPWMVGILRKEQIEGVPVKRYTCGGSIITKNVILTAADCINDKDSSTLLVRVGEWDTQHKTESYLSEDYEVEKVVVHERFNKTDLRNNIALLFLKNDIHFHEKINTVCLPPQNQKVEAMRCLVSGWGKDTEDGVYSAVLKRIEVSTVPHDKCQEILMHESFMCAGGEEGNDACEGDEGGPLVCEIDEFYGQYYQAGIVSWGIACGLKDVPRAYTNVAHFRNWIDEKIAG